MSATPMPLYRQLFDHRSYTYTYLLADAATGAAILIDPVMEQLERDLRLLTELDLKLIYTIETHLHADHVTASGALRARTGCQTAVPRGSGAACADIQLSDGDTLSFGRHRLDAIATPGHTASSLSYLSDGRVFTGDSLLIRGCGRTDFQDGDAAALYEAVTERLFRLDEATVVCPAHDYRGMSYSTIGEERRHNPRFALQRDGFIAFMHALKLPEPDLIHEALPANEACGDLSRA